VDPVGFSLLGIVEDEEDRHQLIGPQLEMPQVDVDPERIPAFQFLKPVCRFELDSDRAVFYIPILVISLHK
jgi:hypothetical protein